MVFGALTALIVIAQSSAQSPDFPKTPEVKPQTQTESGLKSEPRGSTATVPAVLIERGNEKEQGTEFWPPLFGYRLKITDTLVVIFTFLLFLATLALWLATRRLVHDAKSTGETQLRAFVFSKEFEQAANIFADTGRGRYIKEYVFWSKIENVGLTPAISDRISANICRGTASSAIWNVT